MQSLKQVRHSYQPCQAAKVSAHSVCMCVCVCVCAGTTDVLAVAVCGNLAVGVAVWPCGCADDLAVHKCANTYFSCEAVEGSGIQCSRS